MQISGEISAEYLALQRKLKRRGVRLNTLHATLRTVALEGRHVGRERGKRVCAFVAMLGGVRMPDLVRITGLTQPTLWRLVQDLRAAGAVRVESTYRDHVPGALAMWLQPPGSADLDDNRRAALMETAELIREYIPLWQAECGRAHYLTQRAEGYR